METIDEAISFVTSLTNYLVTTEIHHDVISICEIVGQGDEVEEQVIEEISLDSNVHYILRRLESYLPIA